MDSKNCTCNLMRMAMAELQSMSLRSLLRNTLSFDLTIKNETTLSNTNNYISLIRKRQSYQSLVTLK